MICIGSVLWDVIGRTERETPPSADRPGRISRHPGGVAFNIAAARGGAVKLLGHVGRDGAGEELIGLANAHGVDASLMASKRRATPSSRRSTTCGSALWMRLRQV